MTTVQNIILNFKFVNGYPVSYKRLSPRCGLTRSLCVEDVILEFLTLLDLDGLCNPDCFCETSDLMHCLDISDETGWNDPDCSACVAVNFKSLTYPNSG